MEKQSPRIEEYLESIYKLKEMQEPATTSRIAECLDISPSSVSEMLKRLEHKGLIKYAEKDVILTEEGELAARKVIRKHRLSECLLIDILGFKRNDVHEDACRLEHDISNDVENKIEEKLGNPRICPHGYPIPDKEGNATQNTLKLSELKSVKRRKSH